MPTPRRYQIKPGTASPWAIFDDDGLQILADRDLRSPREALGELGALASAEGLSMITQERPDHSLDVEFAPPGQPAPRRETYMLTLEMTPEIHDTLTRIARDTGQSLSDVIRSALGMYQLAVDAHQKGKTVGVSDKPEHVTVRFF